MLIKFNHFEGLNVTINTNVNCTLKCSYCYEMNKAASIEEDEIFWQTTKYKDEKRNYNFIKKPNCKDVVIDVNIAKKFIDQILDFPETQFFNEFVTCKDAIVLDFIGGDSLQYPELLDEILTYFIQQLIKRNHKWLYSWKCSISSNGVTLLNPKARQFCEKWKNNLSLGLSIDGCPELHDLNRWCFADNEDGTHRGSWKYIKEIWSWYSKTFPSDSLRTKWTLAPNSYKYILKSVKYLHEELGMIHLMFNRVMENEIQDTAESLWELIQQFEETMEYLIEHHTEIYCSPFDYNNTKSKTKEEQLKEDPKFSRCGFGVMPTLSLDGNVYPCFRMLPDHNHLKDSSKYAQGTCENILSNQETLEKLNINSRSVNMKNEDKCETCKIFTVCPHCAADCVNEDDGTLTKTTSVCNFTRIEVYFARKYWEKITLKHPVLYKKYPITWTNEENEELMELVLQDVVNLKEKENENEYSEFK